MPTVDNLNQEQLNNAAVLEKVKKLVGEIIVSSETKRASLMAQQMKLALVKLQGSALVQDYQKLQTLLLWIALPTLAEEEVVSLLRRGVLPALGEEIDIEDLVRRRLFVVPLEPREETTFLFRSALEQNSEVLGGKKISEWLTLYNQFQDFAQRNNLSSFNFFNQSQAAQNLNEAERTVLKKVFDLYDRSLLVSPVVEEEALDEIYQQSLLQAPAQSAPTTKTARPAASPPAPTDYLEPVGPEDLKK